MEALSLNLLILKHFYVLLPERVVRNKMILKKKSRKTYKFNESTENLNYNIFKTFYQKIQVIYPKVYHQRFLKEVNQLNGK